MLAPYERVTVKTGDLPLSGDWLLTKVIHRITPHLYTQEFEAKADSKHEAEAAQGDIGGGIGLSVSFSASISVF